MPSGGRLISTRGPQPPTAPKNPVNPELISHSALSPATAKYLSLARSGTSAVLAAAPLQHSTTNIATPGPVAAPPMSQKPTDPPFGRACACAKEIDDTLLHRSEAGGREMQRKGADTLMHQSGCIGACARCSRKPEYQHGRAPKERVVYRHFGESASRASVHRCGLAPLGSGAEVSVPVTRIDAGAHGSGGPRNGVSTPIRRCADTRAGMRAQNGAPVCVGYLSRSQSMPNAQLTVVRKAHVHEHKSQLAYLSAPQAHLTRTLNQ